jgi:hypothetical protein
MTQEQIFDAWAPSWSIWSPWVKPVVFATLPDDISPQATGLPEPVTSIWAPAAGERTALVLDLPGDEGVLLGLSLAVQGYQPVPLYNAHPGPGFVLRTAQERASLAVVDIRPIAIALVAGAERLREHRSYAPAPPAFLLDANRRSGSDSFLPGRFDNRSVSFPTDFPSANFLLSNGINKAILIQRNGFIPQPDVAHTLRHWKSGGIEIKAMRLSDPVTAQPCDLARPSRIALWMHYFSAALGLRHHPLGGFGGTISEPSSG